VFLKILCGKIWRLKNKLGVVTPSVVQGLYKSAIGAFKNSNGTITNDSSIKTELLQSVFTNKFTLDNGTIPSTRDRKAYSKLDSITFTSSLVLRAVKRLKIKTKGGPDGIPPIYF